MQRKDTCACGNRDPSQSVTKSGSFFTISTLLLEGLCVCLGYSFSRSSREKHGFKEIKRKPKPRHDTRSWTGIYCCGLRATSPAGSDGFLDLTGLRIWRLVEPVAEMGISVPFCDITEDLIPEPYVCVCPHLTFE